MKMIKSLFLTWSLLISITHLIDAQSIRNTTEAKQNKKAMATNEAQLERDLHELKVFKAKVGLLDTAYAQKDVSKVATLKADLLSDMQREIKQSENKTAQDQQEVKQSQSELASSKRETRRSRVDRATVDNDRKDGFDVRNDRRDRRDDQLDAKDDKADLEKQIARTKRQKQIHATLQGFTFSFEPTLKEKLVANKALFGEFLTTMENDIAATQAEIAEDKREAREDRWERKEDRRERREKGQNFRN